MSRQTRVKLLIVETNDFIKLGIEAFLSSHEDWELVAVVRNFSAAVEACYVQSPDVILLDANILGEDTISPTAVSKVFKSYAPHVRIAYWTEREAPELLAEILMSNPEGYFRKDTNLQDLLISLSQIARGRKLLSSQLYLSSLISYFKADNGKNETPIMLTPRELQVLRLISQGHSNSEISDQLGIRVSTASVHVSNIMNKLEAENRTHAVLRAAELGLANLQTKQLAS
jgi:DNA-binding NarL/FixJ family response regulator